MASKRKRSVVGGEGKSRQQVQRSRTRGVNDPDKPLGIIFRDNHQRKKFNVLSARKLVNTKYMDDNALRVLGLFNDVNRLFANIGWERFVRSRLDAYTRLTFEFLSSLDVDVVKRDEGLIQFRLFNREYRFTLAEFNGIFGFPPNGVRDKSKDFNQNVFWHAITLHHGYDPTRAKATKIRHPCLRYVHRVMAHTIFGRGDSEGVVRVHELYLMWAMLHHYHVDTGYLLARHLQKVANATVGNIVVGGLITQIALDLKLDITGLQRVQGSSRIDLESLQNMKMIVKNGNEYYLRLWDSDKCWQLPDPIHTALKYEGNWCFPVEEGDGREIVATTTQPPPSPSRCLEYDGPCGQHQEESNARESPAMNREENNAPTLLDIAARLDMIDEHLQTWDAHFEQFGKWFSSMEARLLRMEEMIQSFCNLHHSQMQFPQPSPPPPPPPPE